MSAQAQAPRAAPNFATQLADFWATNAQAPYRDRYDLYQRLGRQATPGVGVIAHQTTKPPLRVGDSVEMQVLDLRTAQSKTISATVQVVTAHLAMLTDAAALRTVNPDALAAVAQTFEDKIYPTTRAAFGEEWNPGVDGDPHIVVLNTPIEGMLGFFSSTDEITKPVAPSSNEREMIYMSMALDGSAARRAQYESTLAHEFQHMIEWRQNGHQDAWLNEGSSVLSELINGYPAAPQAAAFLSTPNTQLNGWACLPGCNVGAHYGAGFLFTNYLRQRFGANITAATIGSQQSGITGVASVERALLATRRTFDLTFDGVFQDWTVSNLLLNRYTPTDSRYAVTNLATNGLKLALPDPVYPVRVRDTLQQYAARYYPLRLPDGERVITLNFSGSSTTPLTAAASLPKSSGRVWWSGRGDNGDMRLTRAFDLCQSKNGGCDVKPGQKLTLQFASWYETEARYDYGFVEVSTDGGAHWQTLPTKFSAKDVASEANYGNGLTGRSDPNGARLDSEATDNAAPQWVRDEADLTPFAGNLIMLRFEYVTDDTYNRDGWMIGDIAIPQIGYADSPEAQTAAAAGTFGADFPTTLNLTDLSDYVNAPTPRTDWQAEGFMRTTNVVGQRWWVQVVSISDAGKVTITPVPVDATGVGTLVLNAAYGKNAIVVVAAGATLSTVAPTFDLTVSDKTGR